MRVLFLSSGNSKNGIAPFIKSQGESLRPLGIQIVYYNFKGKGFVGYIRNIKSLRIYLRLNKFDIIHAHYGLTGLLLTLTFTKTPVVLSLMGSDVYGSYNSQGKRKISSYFEMVATQIAMIKPKILIAKSENIYKYILLRKKACIIPNGVNFSKFFPTSNELKANKILFLADINNPRKNFKLLQEAYNLIKKPEIELSHPYPIIPELIPSIINSASVVVLTSLNEGSPNIIKEAMACNIPIVATNVGDVAEIIKNTEGCYLSSANPSDFASKLLEALDYGKRTLGRHNIEYLNEINVAQKIKECYVSLLYHNKPK
jgi:teichuronic acid biosynthesis glycosyltransferase TuaC